MANLRSEMVFTPIFRPGTIVQINDEPLETIAPDYEFPINPIIRISQPEYFETENIDHEQFLKDTLTLFWQYRSILTLDALREFGRYSRKYGSPFEKLRLYELNEAFRNLYIFAHYREFVDQANLFCKTYSRRLRDEISKFGIIKLHSFDYDDKVFEFKVSHYDPSIKKPEDIKHYPLFQMILETADLPVIEKGTQAQRQTLFKERIFNNFTKMFEVYPPIYDLKIVDNHPVINAKISNPIMFFLFTKLVAPRPFSYCKNPKCFGIAEDGKEFCSSQCRIRYYQTTDSGKIRGLLGKWLNGDKRRKGFLSSTQHQELLTKSLKAITNGATYEDVLKRLQKAKQKILEEGENSGRIN